MKDTSSVFSLAAARPATTEAERAAALEAAERRLGRSLTAGERRVDVVGLDRDFARGKRRLTEAIDDERDRAARSLVDLGFGFGFLEVTPAMRERLRELYRAGRDHALEEVAAAKAQARERSLARREPRRLEELFEALRRRLGDVTVRLQLATDRLDLGQMTRDEALAQLARVPGALEIAADLVSPAIAGGLGDVFGENAGLFTEGWVYSAVMDSGTCDPCGGLDGEQFDSWEAIQEVLPDGGPNPDCDGGDRCRCRPVPA